MNKKISVETKEVTKFFGSFQALKGITADIYIPWLNDYYNTAATLGSASYGGFANIITGIPSYYLANIS